MGFFKELSPARKLSFVFIILMVAVGLVWLIVWGNRVDYRLLYADVSESDAAQIVQRLKEQKVPYQLGRQ